MLTDMTARQAKATGKPYTIADFDGLYLHISAVGGRAWHFRYTWMGQRARISLGSYPELSLREARELRDEARSLVARGINPRTDRIRKLVVESGPQRLSRWLDYERNVRADFEQAFGEPPGALVGIGIMTDTDNTQSQARAWYGPLNLTANN